jgi:hypothetical protein
MVVMPDHDILHSDTEKKELLKQNGSPWTKPVYPIHHQASLNDELKAKMQSKYVGYPALATWMASSTDFFILRRFDYLNARVLLTLQDRIVEKEERLKELDLEEVWAPIPEKMLGPSPDTKSLLTSSSMNGSVRGLLDPKRRVLLDEIKDLLKEYSKSMK